MSAAKTEPDGYAQRVNSGDWESITDEVNAFGGGALLPQLLTAVEAAEIRDLDHVDAAFRQTVTMGPLRFGEGQYKYFHAPYPEPIERLKQALYPRLLPIARDWWGGKLGREAIWPDTLDEWLELCHRAGGQNKSTAILLKYGAGDWNALHRDLYGDLVFPLQVVLNLNQPGVDHTGGEFLLVEQRPPRAQSAGVGVPVAAGTRLCVRHAGPARAFQARLVSGPGPARGGLPDSVGGGTDHSGAGLPRCRVRVR